MLTIYRRPRSEKSASTISSDSDDSKYPSPRGQPYLTKVNGRLVMARKKPRRHIGSNIDLLGSAFGFNTRVVRRKSRSMEHLQSPALLVTSTQSFPPQPQHENQLSWTTPLSQTGLQPIFQPSMAPVCTQHLTPQTYMLPTQPQKPAQVQPEPMRYRVETQFEPLPSKADIEDLKSINAHFVSTVDRDDKVEKQLSFESTTTRTTTATTKHVCANCGKIRSRRYHHEHPIRAGDKPTAAFCGKCQRDASMTSDDDDGRSRRGKESNNMSRIEGARLVAKEKTAINIQRSGKQDGHENEDTHRGRPRLRVQDSREDVRALRESTGAWKPYERGSRSYNDHQEYEIPVKRYAERHMHEEHQSKNEEEIPARTYPRQDRHHERYPERSRSPLPQYQRRGERLHLDEPKMWEQPHFTNPKPGQKTVVTETYTYRPKRESHAESDIVFGGSRTAEPVASARYDRRANYQSFENAHYDSYPRSTSRRPSRSSYDEYGDTRPPRKLSRHKATSEDHAYYQGNWDRNEAYDSREGSLCEYHQYDHRDEPAYWLNGSESSSVQYQRAYDAAYQNIPQAPSPPQSDHLSPEVPHPRSSARKHEVHDDSLAQGVGNDKSFLDWPEKRSSSSYGTNQQFWDRQPEPDRFSSRRSPRPSRVPESIRQESPEPEKVRNRQSSRHLHVEETIREGLPAPERVRSDTLFRHVPAWDVLQEPEQIRSRKWSRHEHDVSPEVHTDWGRKTSRHETFREVSPEPEKIRSRKSSCHTVRVMSPEVERLRSRRLSVHLARRPMVVHETSYLRTSATDDRGREKSFHTLILSPTLDERRFHKHKSDDTWSVSDITNREREAEAAAAAAERHVKFQTPDAVVDASEVA
ncbi:hypothetical protein BJ878DRAFT_482649 [Calycina marina]|uniref:Uncharacterized protein n=1 Tax=Calycina marina TaxID=1763456 RepID=A0A9P7YXX0_9HELO|nr:hypothetical protein BJ878DRAFT_482649 [Calycina marina]